MENKVWRVQTVYGYRTVYFDFEKVEEAAEFIKTCLVHFNKAVSEDQKSFAMSMEYVDSAEEPADD